jgi:hypothetical protein
MKIQLALKMVVSFLLVAGLNCASGPRSIRLQTTPTVPAAEGTVEAKRGPNQNTAVSVEVRHLAKPQRIESGATTYVVWARPLQYGDVQNLGALKIDDELKGKLETVTPLQSFQLFITAEPAPTVSSPSGEPLLTANVRPQG